MASNPPGKLSPQRDSYCDYGANERQRKFGRRPALGRQAIPPQSVLEIRRKILTFRLSVKTLGSSR